MSSPWRTTNLKHKKKTILGALVGLLMVGGAAFAAYVLMVGITGSGTSKSMTATWSGTPQVVAAETTATKADGIAAPAPTITSGRLALPALAYWPDDTFTFAAEARISNPDNGPAKVTGLVKPGLGAGYEARIVSGCGAEATGYGTSGAGAVVKVRITAVGPNPAPTWSLTSGAGVTMSPSSQVPGTPTCAPVTGS